MAFEDVIAQVNQWVTATQALAALGAAAGLPDEGGDPEVKAAVGRVIDATGLTELDQLAPPQRAMLQGLIRMYLHEAVELVDDPVRAPGWTFTDPAILEGWARGSAMIPAALKAAAPELANVTALLDIGAGQGMLAIAATEVWPQARVTGIDIWDVSLDAARARVEAAGLADRITLRRLDVSELDDADAYDCAWFPTFFVSTGVFDQALPRVFRSLTPGGWIVLARMTSPPAPLPAAAHALRTLRAGGTDFSVDQLEAALTTNGCANVRLVPPQGPAPIEYVIGQRPA